nr:hypothetical protein QGKEIAJE_QGKEIAJE_CDS_0019 [uncultured phage]
MANYLSCQSVNILSIDATCDESRASIKRVLVCPKEDIEVIGYQYIPISSTYPNDYEFQKSTLINNLVLADNKKFVEFKFRRNTGSYTSTYTGDNTTGSQVVTTEVTLQFSKAENQKRLEFQKLTGHPCVMLIEDAYGKYIALGVDAPVVLTNTVMQSGTAKSDLSGFTLTFTEESNTTEVTLQFSKAENQKRLEFQKLTGHPCVMLIEDAYGKYIALGVDAPVVLTNTVMQSGTAKSDLSGFTLTFTEESNIFPPFVKDYDNYNDYGDIVLVDSLLMDEVFTPIILTTDSWDYDDRNQNISVTDNGSTLTFYQPSFTYLAINQGINAEFIYVTRNFVSNGSGHYEYTFSVEGYEDSTFSIAFYLDEEQGVYGTLSTKNPVILDARAVRISYDAEISDNAYTLSNFKVETQSTGL